MTNIELMKTMVKRFLSKLSWKFISKFNLNVESVDQCYPDLAPTDNAELVEPYIERLDDLLFNRFLTIKEIAITAPYSGGKSSLINTYMRQRQNFNYVTISLASFKSIEQSVGVEGSKAEEKTDNNNLVDITKIEKSILQQILYRSDRKDTPNSRFRRIFPTPLSDKTAAFYSSSLLIWISLLSVYLDDFNLSNLIRSLSENELSLTGMLDSITSLNLWAFSYLISVPFLLFRDAIKPLGQYTITKINPLKGDVAFSSKSNDSVFNKYLEEIIYFFEAQKTDIVIFEDLDRFNNSDIFEKLKELNKLINDSNDVKQSVRFVYALKDDVFTGSNRTRNFNRPPIII
jgi:hypothetical protein